MPEWSALLSLHPANNLFVTPTWNRAWWRAFGGDIALRLLAMRSGQRLVGVAAYMLYSVRLRGLPLRVLGSFTNPHVSRTDVAVAPGFESAVGERLAGYFAETTRDWDVALLQQLPADAAWVPAFVAALPGCGLLPFGPVPGVAKCVLPLHGTWAEFLSARSGHFRARLKENLRRVEKHGKVVYRKSEGSAEDFNVLARLEAGSWKGDDEATRLGPTGWAFQREVALAVDAGIRCSNLFLEIDGRVVGAIHAVGHGDALYTSQMMFDESIRHLYPGRALFARLVADAFADTRYKMLDLNGDSEFCKSWSDSESRFISLRLFNRRPYSQLLWRLKRLRGGQP